MKTYIADIIPKIQRFSQKLDNLTLLKNQHWVLINEIENSKNVYIFRDNNQLLISQNGKIEKATWEYLGNDAIMIDRQESSYLFKHGFFDENVLALKLDSKEEYAFMVNETKFGNDINSVEGIINFLEKNYLNNESRKKIEESVGLEPNESNLKPQTKIYNAPSYEITKKKKINSLFSYGKTKCYIHFEDGIDGIFYHDNNSNNYFFKENDGLFSVTHHYNSQESCIDGLHCNIKSGEVLKFGHIATYS